MVCLGYCNVASIPAKVVSNSKVNAIRKYACKNDLDGFFGIKANINWKGMPPEGQLLEFFHSENELQTVASYNTFENFGCKQQGGTFGLAFRQLASKVQDIGQDDLGKMVLDAFPGMCWPPGQSDCGISALQGNCLSGGYGISAT